MDIVVHSFGASVLNHIASCDKTCRGRQCIGKPSQQKWGSLPTCISLSAALILGTLYSACRSS